MATGQLAVVLRHIRYLAAANGVDGLSDAQLLERYCATQEEEAFAALVQRHGGLVLGVCRRVQGKTNRQAASALGWPTGTMSRRLARARELLRRNLARRGVVVPTAALAAALGAHAAPAAVSLSLLNATVTAGLVFGGGRTAAG